MYHIWFTYVSYSVTEITCFIWESVLDLSYHEENFSKNNTENPLTTNYLASLCIYKEPIIFNLVSHHRIICRKSYQKSMDNKCEVWTWQGFTISMSFVFSFCHLFKYWSWPHNSMTVRVMVTNKIQIWRLRICHRIIMLIKIRLYTM